MAGSLPAHALLQAHASDSLLAGRVTSLDVSPFDYFNCLLRIPVADAAPSRSAGKKAPCPMVSAIGMRVAATFSTPLCKCELVDAD